MTQCNNKGYIMTNKELLIRLQELEEDARNSQDNQDKGSQEYGENQGVIDTIGLIERWLQE